MSAQYSKPEITQIGSVAELTQAAATGPKTDAAFPDNTPAGQLTFS